MLPIRLIYKHTQSGVIKVVVDSGSTTCVFHMDLCKALGIKNPQKGFEGTLGGIVGGRSVPVYYHSVTILVGAERFETVAGFAPGISVAGILGRKGFFENFRVTIDPSEAPPSLEVVRIHRV